MNKYLIFLIINISFVFTLDTPFKHVVVLMMENHSYDNMLGMMDAPIGSVQQKSNCNTYKDQEFCQKSPAAYQTIPDPGHTYYDTNFQLYNRLDFPNDNQYAPNMQGFAADYGKIFKGDPQNIMDCYDPEQIPILTTLAQEFTVFDNWFSSLPSLTIPNKVFSHAATSNGNVWNCFFWYCSGWPINAETIQTKLQDEGYSWGVHWMDWAESMGIYPMNQEFDKFHYDQDLKKLYQKFQDGTLDNYTYIVPRFFNDEALNDQGEYYTLYPNSQHPSEDVRNGELLIKQVYENLRKSPHWDDTLLLIVYDEHGGFYDHVVPPMNVTNPTPDEKSGPLFDFTFERLGVRVPSIAISPWLQKSVDSTQLEHSSIPHTIHDIFNLKSDYLNPRDQNSNSFIRQDMILKEKRKDCPELLPQIPQFTKQNPMKQSNGDKILNGGPKSQVELLGTMLVKKGKLNIIKYKQIIEKIKNDKQAVQFIKEAQYILGYRPLFSIKKFKYLDNINAQEQF